MKKECAYTQGMLGRYLKGYLFLPQQKRVERHLASCPLCRSRHDALRQTEETRELLRYLDPNAGIAGRAKAGEEEISVEIRSVNHKFCEVKARLPQELAALEGEGAVWNLSTCERLDPPPATR